MEIVVTERDVQDHLGRPITDQELEAVVRPLLARGVTLEGVLDALRATEKPVRQASDGELRTIRYEALPDGSLRRIRE